MISVKTFGNSEKGFIPDEITTTPLVTATVDLSMTVTGSRGVITETTATSFDFRTVQKGFVYLNDAGGRNGVVKVLGRNQYELVVDVSGTPFTGTIAFQNAANDEVSVLKSSSTMESMNVTITGTTARMQGNLITSFDTGSSDKNINPVAFETGGSDTIQIAYRK